MKRTSLYDCHRQAGARLVEFGGFEMPVQYTGIMDEHRTVRAAVGLFDVSHMGEYAFRGRRALEVCQRIFTNNLARLQNGDALYTVMCRPSGGIVDDCVVYRQAAEHYLVVVNASNIDKDGAHFREVAAGDCEVINESDAWALIAVQGPRAMATVESISDRALSQTKSFTICQAQMASVGVQVSRSGYTGEDGVEIFCGCADASHLWDALLVAGKVHGIKPCGLGARDTLRLEAKLCLYGNDIDETTSPLEAGLGWVVKSEADYVGRPALMRQKAAGTARSLVCLVMLGRGIARHGMSIRSAHSADDGVGIVTSGSPSPTLGKNIAMGYVPRELAELGTPVQVDVRGHWIEAEVVKGPFYKRSV